MNAVFVTVQVQSMIVGAMIAEMTVYVLFMKMFKLYLMQIVQLTAIQGELAVEI